MYVYIYIERERQRNIDIDRHVYIYIYSALRIYSRRNNSLEQNMASTNVCILCGARIDCSFTVDLFHLFGECHVFVMCYTPSPPIKSLDFGGFDSNKLLILRGGNYHIRIIV